MKWLGAGLLFEGISAPTVAGTRAELFKPDYSWAIYEEVSLGSWN